MRNPDRIDSFCRDLAELWHKVPDWRFGQLMSNMLGAYVGETKKDIFFPEDDEMMAFFKKYFAPKDKGRTIKIHGESDDLVYIEGSSGWDNEYGCYDRDVIIYFTDGTMLRMTYAGHWKAVVEKEGDEPHMISQMIDGDDYYSDMFEISNTDVWNVRLEDN